MIQKIFMAFFLILTAFLHIKTKKQKKKFYSQVMAQGHKIIEQKCSHCHQKFSYLTLHDWRKTGYIDFKNPENSLLLKAVEERKMPPRSGLSQEEIQTITHWVKAMPLELKPKVRPSNNPLSPLEHFTRCHTHMTGLPPHFNKENFKSYQDSTQACLNILNQKKEILPTFHIFHQSWFKSFRFFGTEDTFATYDIYDIHENSLGLSYSLISNTPLKNIFKGHKIFNAIRKNNDKNLFSYPFEGLTKDKHPLYQGVQKNKKEFSPQYIQRGPLLDVQEQSRFTHILSLMPNRVFSPQIYKGPLYYKRPLGGGVLGSIPYLILNMEQYGVKNDGKSQIPRKWGQAIFKEYLCRSLPVVNPEDSIKMIDKESSYNFDKKQSCVQCHSSMDNLAHLLRNTEIVFSNNIANHKSLHLYSHEFSKKRNSPYHLLAPQGLFYYRTVFGHLVEEKMKDFDDLGDIITELDDFYWCITSKYINFFTGKKLRIEALPYQYSQSLYYRYLYQWGIELKKHQSLKKLVHSIISSPIYRDRFYKASLIN